MISLLTRLADDHPNQPEEFGEHSSVNIEDKIIDEVMMILSSRPRSIFRADDPLLQGTIINYGINEHFPSDLSQHERYSLLRERIKNSLITFEPRLKNIHVAVSEKDLSETVFTLEADYNSHFIRCFLVWDDAMSQFFLRE